MEISEIKRNYRGHFFDRDTMRFFRSRVSEITYAGVHNIYFVTSEQFVSLGCTGPRLYTVRRYNIKNNSIETVGEFNKLNRSAAHNMALRLASKEKANG